MVHAEAQGSPSPIDATLVVDVMSLSFLSVSGGFYVCKIGERGGGLYVYRFYLSAAANNLSAARLYYRS